MHQKQVDVFWAHINHVSLPSSPTEMLLTKTEFIKRALYVGSKLFFGVESLVDLRCHKYLFTWNSRLEQINAGG
jgi:hypothetical protein